MWAALGNLSRYIATARVAKYRLFVWLDARVCPDSATIAIARDDDTTFGILHSRFHEAWSLRLCTWLGKGNDPRYTPTTTFGTFPFPDGLTPNTPAADYADDPRAAAIADAAQRLVELRDRWLNPPEWVEWLDEPVPGYPTRPVPRDETAATALKTRTLTNLYNTRPQWLADAHATLDAAVATAYGWPTDISDDDALAELLALNLANPNPARTGHDFRGDRSACIANGRLRQVGEGAFRRAPRCVVSRVGFCVLQTSSAWVSAVRRTRPTWRFVVQRYRPSSACDPRRTRRRVSALDFW